MSVLVFNALFVKRRIQHNALLYHLPLNVDKLYILLKQLFMVSMYYLGVATLAV